MDSVAPVLSSSWFPQDDLLLQNAVETGASLESLAKGAVEFSRRFTLEEVTDRWHALLYDPIISLDASSQMSRLKMASHIAGSKANSRCQDPVTLKRKSESVRNSYYAMRKRTCHDPVASLDSGGYLVSPIISDGCIRDSDELFSAEDFGLNDQSCSELGFLSFPPADDVHIHQDVIEAQIPQVSVDNSCFDKIHCSTKVEFTQPKEVPNLDPFETYFSDNIDDHACSSITGADGVMNSDISDSLHYCSTFSEPQFFTSVSEMRNQDAFGSPDYANSLGYDARTTAHLDTKQESHLPPSCPMSYELLEESLLDPSDEEKFLMLMDINQNDSTEKDYIDSLNFLLMDPSDYIVPNIETMEAAPGIHQSLASVEAEGDKILPPVLRWESSLISSQIRPTDKLHKETEFCVLNTEDTEVPCNDDVFLMYQMSPPAFPYSSLEMERPQESCNPGLSFVHNDFQSHEVGSRKLERSIPQMLNTLLKSSEENNYVRINIPYAEKQTETVVVDNRVINNNNDASFAASNHQAYQTQHPEHGSMMNEEEEAPLESDDEVPNFSDVEAMILDMDLIPDNKDSRPVFGYHNDESKREVMRLEQSAASCIHRAIADKHALAVICSRHTKYFVKKPEVLVGRTIDDYCKVDIDLSREPRASRISRRQAIIKMDENGCFSMKNLGNGIVFVNGKKIASKQTVNLPSNCLIDVRGICFIFETFAGSMKKLLKEKYGKLS